MNLRRTAIILAIASLAVSASAQLRLPRPSPKASVMQSIGLTDVTITYSRPGVKGRTIWGSLVPFDQVWRTGANEQTIFTVSSDVKINGNPLPAGTYSLHSIPTRTSWTLIFNRKADPNANYSYDEKEDALRVQVTPVMAAESEELMTFSFPKVTMSSAEVHLSWEKVRVPFTIEADTVNQALTAARKTIDTVGRDAWRVPYQAATFAFDNKTGNMEEAWKWVEQSIAATENYWNTNLKARMLAEMGKKKEAIAAGERAIALAKASPQPIDTAAFEKTLVDWKRK